MAKQLLSKVINNELSLEIEERVKGLEQRGIKPTLAILRVGDNPDDISYERSATKRCEKYGIRVEGFAFKEDVSFDELASCINKINDDNNINGLLLLRPLPKHIDEERLCNLLDPSKDIDGITDAQAAKIYKGSKYAFAPCTARASMEMLKRHNIEIEGKNVVVVGRSAVIGKPLALMLIKENATVTVCHSKTKDLKNICKRADIIVVAIGKPKFITADYVSEGQTIIDVGIHYLPDGSMCGDVDYEDVCNKVSAITPVPGGVGGVTTSILLLTLLEAAENFDN